MALHIASVHSRERRLPVGCGVRREPCAQSLLNCTAYAQTFWCALQESPFNRAPLLELIDTLSQHPVCSSAAGSSSLRARPSSGDVQGQGSAAGGTEAAGSENCSASPQPLQPGHASHQQNPNSSSETPHATPPPPPPSSHPLLSLPLCELHEASWYAVAWYPVYRVPDAPLVSRFLTFHSFASLVDSMQAAQQHEITSAALLAENMQAAQQQGVSTAVYLAHRMQAAQQQEQGSALGKPAGAAEPKLSGDCTRLVQQPPTLPVQLVGLKWYNM